MNTALKMNNIAFYQTYRFYLSSKKFLNAGKFSSSWILQCCNFIQKDKEIRHCMFTFSKNITLHFKVVHWISKKCTKRDNTSAKMFFAHTTIIVFMAAIL